jgi:hypothetical protein
MLERFAGVGREFLLISVLTLLTIAINWPVITCHFVYPEQALFYNVNHALHSFVDLVHVYTQPKLLDVAAPFSRPSGNFLMYQLLAPVLGWHNLQAFIVVNLIFLSLCGYLIIKLYKIFFSGCSVGGYIASSVFVMNPGLILSRLVVMHFEFAYVFFALLSLYCFSRFCEYNRLQQLQAMTTQKFNHLLLLLATCLCYVVAVTFKESAIMMGPVLALYLLCRFYQGPASLALYKNKDFLAIVALLGMVSIALGGYLMLSWQSGSHPLLVNLRSAKAMNAAHQFFRYLVYLPVDHNIHSDGASMQDILRLDNMTSLMRYLAWGMLTVTVVSLLNVFRQKNGEYKQSVVFLFLAMLLFMVLPMLWAMGFSWHLNLAFVCEALLIGFGIEFYLKHFLPKQLTYWLSLSLAMLIALSTYQVDQLNINAIPSSAGGLAMTLNYNALYHPPMLNHPLNENSILIVQDNMNIGDYFMGDSTYPALIVMQSEAFNFDTFIPGGQQHVFWRVQPKYNGTLFRWAYLMPNLKEEVVPFQNDNMRLVTDTILQEWLTQINNITCVTYDKAGLWFDNTATFKKNILTEQKRRHLHIYPYQQLFSTALHSAAVKFQQLPYADAGICKTYCDNHPACKGFTYAEVSKHERTMAQCFYYNKIAIDQKPCSICTGYIKLNGKANAV